MASTEKKPTWEGIKKISKFYSPEPVEIEVWYEEKDDIYGSIARINANDNWIILATWDCNYNQMDQIIIDNTIYKKIKKHMKE